MVANVVETSSRDITHPQPGYNFPVLRAPPAGQIALHFNYTTLHAHPGPLPPLPPASRDSFSLQDSLNGVRARAFLWKIPAEWAPTYGRRGWACRAEEGKTADRDGDMPVSRKRIGVRLFFARSHLVRRKKAEPFRGEERRGGVGGQDGYIRMPHRAEEQFSVVFFRSCFHRKDFSPLERRYARSGGEGRGEGTRARGHSWKNKSLHEFLEHRHGWSSLRSSRDDPVSLG